jgi:hypothetical protein
VAVVAPAADARVAGIVLGPLAPVGPLVVAVAAVLLLLRRVLGRRSPALPAATWGCGYAVPSVAMQYTSSSFAEPLTRVLSPVLRTERRHRVDPGPTPLWPRAAHWASHTTDRALVGFYLPVVAAVARAGARIRAYHQARVTGSLLYIGATVLVMLVLLVLRGARP